LRSHRYIGVDLLRFAAASLVMLFHLGLWSWVAPNGTAATVLRGATTFPELQGVAAPGWVGVQIFFVISGFVIAFSAEGAAPGAFLARRFLRLFPGALICAAVSAAVILGEGIAPLPATAHRFFNSMTLSLFGPWIDGVYWTLGVEIAFYALVLLLLVLRRERQLPSVIAVIGLVSSAVVALRTLAPHSPLGALLPPAWSRDGQLFLLDHGMFFCLGVMLWVASRRGWSFARAAVAAVCVAGGIVQIGEATGGGNPLAPIAIWLAAMGLLVAAILWDEALTRLAGRWAPAAALVGLATYPLYLLHTIVGAAVLRSLVLAGVPRFAALALSMAAAVALALLVTRFPERWLRRALSGAAARLPAFARRAPATPS